MSDPITQIQHDGIPLPPLPILLDVKENLFKPKGFAEQIMGAEIKNGAYRYCWSQLYENIDHPLGYPAHPKVPALYSKPGFIQNFIPNVGGVDHYVEPRKAFLMELAFLPDKQGKRSVALNHGFIGRYRLEIIGPSLLDTTMLPDKYREDGSWRNALAATIVDQIVIPLIGIRGDFNTVRGGSAIEDVAKWEQWFTLGTTCFDVVMGVIRAHDSGSATQGFAILASNIALGLADAISNPNAMPTPFLQGKATKLRSLLEARGMHKLPSRIKFWANTIELSAVVISLTGAHPVDNYMIDVPLRYKTSIISTPLNIEVGVLERPELHLQIEWIERTPGTQNSGVNRVITTNGNLEFANAQLVQEQDADGTTAPTLQFTDILYRDSLGHLRLAPISVHLRVEPQLGTERPLEIDPWNPDWGPGPTSLAFNSDSIGELFRASKLGTGELSVRILNESELFPYPTSYRLTEERIPLVVGHSSISSYFQEDFVFEVGERQSIELAFALPDGTYFDLNEPFWADIEPLDDGERIRIYNIHIEMPDQWTDDTIIVDIPIQLFISYETDDDERRLRLYLPEPTDLSLGLNLHYEGLGEIIGARQSGDATLNVFVFSDGLPEGVDIPDDHLSCIVNISPVEMSAEIESLEGPSADALTLEDTLIDDALVGTFDLLVSAGNDEIYTTEGEALMEVEVEDDRLRINKLWQEDEAGDLQQLPFQIHLHIEDESIARFSFERVNGQEFGNFTFSGHLTDVVEAVSPGNTNLTVFMLQPANADELDVVYDIGSLQQATLPIHVPSPLEPNLDSWEGEQQPERALSATPHEIIRSSGTLTGSIENHRSESSAEEISLEIDGPQGTSEIIIWEEGAIFDNSLLNDAGDLAIPLNGLDLGDNTLTLSAWKPIHTVMGQDKATVSRVLRAVEPRDVSITAINTTGTVLRRDVGPIIFTHRRSVTARFEAEPPSGSGPTVDFDGSYGIEEEEIVNIVLEAQTGNHTLRLTAENDFGSVSDTRTLVAPVPNISASGARVGHSTTSFSLNVAVAGALQFRAEFDGNIILDQPITSSDGSDSIQVSVPALAVGNNQITLSAWNEFNHANPSTRVVNIERRDNTMIIMSSDLLIGVAENSDDGSKKVALNTTLSGFTTNHGLSWRHVMGFPPPGEYPVEDGFSARWQTFEIDEDGNAIADEFEARIEFAGVAEDPELNIVSMIMAIPTGVVTDNLEQVFENANGFAFSTGAILSSGNSSDITIIYV